MNYDVIIIGAGHAGVEAALATSRLGFETLLLTLNIDSIALMPCNPSIGGTGKGHLVRELDALGGEMGLAIDDTMLQSRMLNVSKGPAVHSLRAQADKKAYQMRMQNCLFAQERLTVRQAEVDEILVSNGKAEGIRTASGDVVKGAAVVVATGVYLKSKIIIGDKQWDSGPQGFLPANGLSKSLQNLGFALRRFKTGTPARVIDKSIDFSKTERQEGDKKIVPFSFLTDKELKNLVSCYLTYTNQETHQIILENLHLSPMFSGQIKGTGARYCPSIEDKIYRFSDKDRHQLFLEPEGLTSHEWYVQGMSSSLPESVQLKMYRTVPGLENAVLTRLAYAIEYDCIDPLTLLPSMETIHIKGLFFAGQINGTSGYEEAAAQGILAGINAAQYLKNAPPVILTRDMSYIGVLTDDLTTKGTDEPYRMMTSRAEHRLFLRQDNADIRLTQIGFDVGLASDERKRRMERKIKETEEIKKIIAENGNEQYLRRPESSIFDLSIDFSRYHYLSLEQAEIQTKYQGYLQKQYAQIKNARYMEDKRLPSDTPYEDIHTLRIEARQKLSKYRPISLGQASRIPGVSPADISVLSIWLMKRENEKNS